MRQLKGKARRLEAACDRALGRPDDPLALEELLWTLDLDGSFASAELRASIKGIVKQVRAHSQRIAERLRSELDGQSSDVAYVISDDIECLRGSLQALLKV
jgi:hypothetical protein